MPLSVRDSVRSVIDRCDYVRIDEEALRRWCLEVAPGALKVPAWNAGYHFFDGTERTLNYLLVLDSINFSFWGEPRWELEYRGDVLKGYWALAASLKRALADGLPITEASFLESLTPEQLGHILRGKNEIPLLEIRTAILRQVGYLLRRRYGGRFASAVEEAKESAVELVRTLVAEFPFFNDVASHKGREVRFYKRAQILVADLFGSFGGQGWGSFHDLAELTAFADYRLPQALRWLGVLEYHPFLARKISGHELLAPGSQEEVEVRACAVWAVELMRQHLSERGLSMFSFQIDWHLWELSQSLPQDAEPHHLTRTIWY